MTSKAQYNKAMTKAMKRFDRIAEEEFECIALSRDIRRIRKKNKRIIRRMRNEFARRIILDAVEWAEIVCDRIYAWVMEKTASADYYATDGGLMLDESRRNR